MRIALVQMRCEKGDFTGNLRRIGEEISAAEARGIDLIAFPEMSISGYIDPTASPGAVLGFDAPEIAEVVAMTGGRQITAITGFVERNPDGKPFITQLVARRGDLAGFYRKRHVIDEELEWFTPGPRRSPIFEHGETMFALSVCADIDEPLVFEDAAAAGARLIVECAAPGLYGEQATRDWPSGYEWWRGECYTKLGTYARTNGVSIAVATQAGRTVDEDFPGGGYLFGPDGACLAETADWSECVLDVELPDGA